MTSASLPVPSRTASAPRVAAASAPAARVAVVCVAVACVGDAALPAGPWCGHAHHHVWN